MEEKREVQVVGVGQSFFDHFTCNHLVSGTNLGVGVPFFRYSGMQVSTVYYFGVGGINL